MIPITRKELYLNKIVGNDDYDIPEKPITTEEFFFAEILGEAVQAPEPLPRYQIYLAKIAGKNVEIPYPETRLEYFLARAAGMDVETPTPITREEIFWSNYHAIVDFEFEGVPPLSFKAKAGALKDYRIYGNTVNGESVGDRTRNLFDIEQPEIKKFDFEKVSFGVYTTEMGSAYNANRYRLNTEAGKTYRLEGIASAEILVQLSGFLPGTLAPENGAIAKAGNISINFIAQGLTTLSIYSPTAGKVCIIDKLQVIEGSTPLPYEPYGYKAPVTVSNGTDTQTIPIYLPEQIKKVGDEAEYIDYEEQKLHRVGADDIDVTLPELPTLESTNVLTVGTVVQPSKVYIKGQKERD